MAKRVYTDEQRQRNREYLRAYRAAHPERVKAWRDAYIVRRAARLRAEAETRGEGLQNNLAKMSKLAEAETRGEGR